MARRDKGEGSYDVLPDGTERFRITVNGKTYTRKAATKPELKKKVKALFATLGRGVDPASQWTVASYLGHWLDTIVKPNRKANTFRGYEQHARLYLIPTLGTVKLKDLTSNQIRMALADLENPNRSEGVLTSATVTGALRALKTALNCACKESPPLIGSNPAANIKRKPIEPKAKRTIIPANTSKFIEACSCTRFGDALLVLISTGLRESELLGLWWQDLDFTQKPPVLHVRRVLSRRDEGEILYEPPKSAHSKRTIPLGEVAISALNRLREYNRPKPEYARHVITSETGKPLCQGALYRALRVRLKANGLPVSGLHDLRKTYATSLARNNVPMHVTHYVLGHATMAVTLSSYIEVLTDDVKTAASKAVSFPARAVKRKREPATKT